MNTKTKFRRCSVRGGASCLGRGYKWPREVSILDTVTARTGTRVFFLQREEKTSHAGPYCGEIVTEVRMKRGGGLEAIGIKSDDILLLAIIDGRSVFSDRS